MTIQARLDWLELEIGSSIDAQSGKATLADINRRENQLSSTSDGRNNAKKFLCRILLDISEVEMRVLQS